MQWENAEMDAIHSLQLILRDSFREAENNDSKAVVHTHMAELELQGVDELSSVAREMVRLIETATAPIFAVDVEGRINGWNAKVSELTGLLVEEAMGKSLVHDLVYKESQEIVDKLLSHALKGILSKFLVPCRFIRFIGFPIFQVDLMSLSFEVNCYLLL
jgi:phytochrome B